MLKQNHYDINYHVMYYMMYMYVFRTCKSRLFMSETVNAEVHIIEY
jgi:hypothetical protein